MNDAQTTATLLAFFAIVLIAWDVRVAFFNDEDNRLDTISGIMRKLGHRLAVIPYALGVIMGHFWGTFPLHFRASFFIPCLILNGLLLSVAHRHYRLPKWASIMYILNGIAAGALLWSQG